MNIHLRILSISLGIAMLTILIFPGKAEQIGLSYGFPFHFFRLLQAEKWFITGVSIDLLYYLLNVMFFYFIVIGLRKVYLMLKKPK